MKGWLNFAKTVFVGNRVVSGTSYCISAVFWQVRRSLGCVFSSRLTNDAVVSV